MKIASANMNMASPTGDAAMLATTIATFCTVKYRFHSLTGPKTIRSSSLMGMVPKMLCNTRTFWLRHSRKHERDGALREQGSMQLEAVGC
jgi:hypothetical protein